MKTSKKIISIIISIIMAFSLSNVSYAEDSNGGTPYPPIVKVLDNIFGAAHDALFSVLINLTKENDIPEYEQYASQTHSQFYKGTDGKVSGDNWCGGFSSGSIIPKKWRCNASGKSDPNGSCLKTIRATGGYQTFVSKLYTDQMLNMIILSNETDSNHNGIKDIIIFISIDGVGITAGTCTDIRESVEKSLKKFGITPDDILACNVSATHCHAALDTQGMCIPTLFLNKLNPFTNYIRSLSKDMEDSITACASECAEKAYSKIEIGSLKFFETDTVSGASDKLKNGSKTKNWFSCFLFKGLSGEKTLISNIGAHPTSYGAWDNNQMMCADYPYFMSLALKDNGYNIVFTQSAQASVSSPNIEIEEGSAKDVEANDWVKSHSLTKEDWIEKYGQKYTDKHFDKLEISLERHMKKGYLLARHILDSVSDAEFVKPAININNQHTLLGFDYGVMAWGSISGLLGENVVKTDISETGYGVMVETDYIELGDIAIITAPGELSPALVFGTDPEYIGNSLWTGKTSWTGEEWQYDTLVETVRKITGDSDKTVLVMGITNDALGYMYPDICTPKSLLATAIFYKENPGDMTNCMLMTVGTKCGSQLMEGFEKIIVK